MSSRTRPKHSEEADVHGIKLAHGTIFVTDGVFTVRLLKNGECTLSPITYRTLEWDLRTENPENWEYMTESDIRTLPDGAYEKIKAIFEESHGKTRI